MHSNWWTQLPDQPPRNREPFDDLGPVQRYFVGLQKDFPFDLSFTQPCFRDVMAWRAEATRVLRECLILPARKYVPTARLRRRIEKEEYIQEEIEFESRPGLPVPATILIPRTGKPPYPGVIALHDMGGFRAYGREKMLAFDGEPGSLTEHRQKCYQGRSVMLELVRRGYVVIAIDALLFGERTPAAWKDFAAFDAARRSWQTLQEQFTNCTQSVSNEVEREGLSYSILTGQTWAGMIAHDDLATLDYLSARPEVDAQRIGCVGLSFGAYRANYLAALDERIRAAVSVCWTSTMDGLFDYNVKGAIGMFVLVPGLHSHLDFPDIQSLACPRAFLAISGWQDLLMQPFGIKKAHEKLRAVYEKAGAAQQLGSLVYDAPHEFNIAMQERAFEWLNTRLQ